MNKIGLNPEAIRAWCAELRRAKARTAFMREELPMVLAQSGEEVAAALCADLELLDIHAALLETWLLTVGAAGGRDIAAQAAG